MGSLEWQACFSLVAGTIKWLKKNTDWEFIISYADEEQGHTGVIYKACNFNLNIIIKKEND